MEDNAAARFNDDLKVWWNIVAVQQKQEILSSQERMFSRHTPLPRNPPPLPPLPPPRPLPPLIGGGPLPVKRDIGKSLSVPMYTYKCIK